MGTDNLVVAVIYSRLVDVDRLRRLAAGLARPVEVRVGHYEDDAAMRMTKRRGGDPDLIRREEPEVTDETRAAVADAEVVLALDAPVDLLGMAPGLRWIQAVGAGVGQFQAVLAGSGVLLTTSAGVGAPPIAEFVIGRLLQVWKDFRLLDQMQQDREWAFTPGRMLAGCTLGVVGLGAIGRAVADRARALGMRVVATRRRYEPGMTSPHADELLGPDGLDHLLEVSDAVVIAAPETTDTEDLIGERQLARMRPDSVLCNVARGSLLDEQALVAALESGHLRAAILDVTRREPLPADDPLWDAPNLYLSPHSSASQDGYFDRLVDLFVDNLGRYIRGDTLANLVDWGAGY